MMISELEQLPEFIIRRLRQIDGDQRSLGEYRKRLVVTPQLAHPQHPALLAVVVPKGQRPEESIKIAPPIHVGEVDLDPLLGIGKQRVPCLTAAIASGLGQIPRLLLELGWEVDSVAGYGDLPTVAAYHR